jgi:hypothetical protein
MLRLRLTAEDMQRLREMAGKESVSSWCRRRLLGESRERQPEVEKVVATKRKEAVKRCPHGNSEGHYCLKCDRAI